MNNLYIFIIWNKALWCKDKILNDLKQSFNIKSSFYINWDNKHYEDNLKAFYGRKLGPVKDKILSCGKGKFLFVAVEDNNPSFQERHMYDGNELVNSNIYDKKMLYRKWTAGSHRIHCSDTVEETNHDLSVLFGTDYQKYLNNNNSININSKGISGFNSTKDLINCLKLFGNNITVEEGDRIIIISKCRLDLVSYIKPKKITNNQYKIDLNGIWKELLIFGELDGDLPKGTYYLLITKKDNIQLFVNSIDGYLKFVEGYDKLPSKISDFFNKNYLDENIKQIDINRTAKGISIFKHIKNEINLIKKKIKYNL